jgi:hypothetical protein
MGQEPSETGQLHTLGLLERLRTECEQLWGSSSEIYFRIDGLLRELANPNLHDIPRNFRPRARCSQTLRAGGEDIALAETEPVEEVAEKKRDRRLYDNDEAGRFARACLRRPLYTLACKSGRPGDRARPAD